MMTQLGVGATQETSEDELTSTQPGGQVIAGCRHRKWVYVQAPLGAQLPVSFPPLTVT